MSKTVSVAGPTGCLALIIGLLLNFFIGGFAVNYVLASVTAHTTNFFVAGIIGFFLGELAIPLAIICWILRIAGVHVPFFNV